MKLEIGRNNHFEIRYETINASVSNQFDILFLSDLHLNKYSKGMVAALEHQIRKLQPDLVLLGGDYIDSKMGLEVFSSFINKVSRITRIIAIDGNHDRFFGIDRIKRVFSDGEINWLENSEIINVKGTRVHLSREAEEVEPEEKDFSILLQHKPKNLKKYAYRRNLSLAGHLHGCQFVFWTTQRGLYPGYFFYKNNYLKRLYKGELSLISKGLGDTLPVRFNCKKDMILIQVRKENK